MQNNGDIDNRNPYYGNLYNGTPFNGTGRLNTNGLTNRRPVAEAQLYGSEAMPGIRGTVRFYTAPGGTIVETRVNGLPPMSLPTATPQVGPFGYHIHEGTQCGSGAGASPFADAGGHYNPSGQPHPLHAGDLPVLFPNDGFAYSRTYTDRFRPSEVVGRTVVIHEMPDDYRTQPAGDSGMRIACGPIENY